MANPFIVIASVVVSTLVAGFGAIQVPGWAAETQDTAAVSDLNVVKSGEHAARALGFGYQNATELVATAPRLTTTFTVADGATVCVGRSTDGAAHVAVTRSGSGRYFAEINGQDTGSGASVTDALASAGGLPASLTSPMGASACTAGTDLRAALKANPNPAAAPAIPAAPAKVARNIITYSVRCDTATSFAVPLAGVSGTVKWSDGTQQAASSTPPSRALAAGVQYRVDFEGTFTAFDGNATAGRACIRTVDKWTTTSKSPVKADRAFTNMPNLTAVPRDVPPLSSTMSMFSGSVLFNSDISGWDVSNVTDMTSMFSGASTFNQDISTWNTGKVTGMDYMFMNAKAFQQDLRPWTVKLPTPFSFTTGASMPAWYLPLFPR